MLRLFLSRDSEAVATGWQGIAATSSDDPGLALAACEHCLRHKRPAQLTQERGERDDAAA
jgi:hypothetical protein